MRVRIAVVAAVVALGSAGAAMAFSPAATPTLKGTVGPGYTISLKNLKGAKVKTLKAGSYKIVVSDKSSIHNFVIEGKGVSKAVTSIPFKGTKSAVVKLRKGKYKFYCHAHESSMFGFITVT